jgi:hypothetical protein
MQHRTRVATGHLFLSNILDFFIFENIIATSVREIKVKITVQTAV